ncbi:MFS transporter [Gottfriedia acidiceleris]|uniref:MFS transporter n=1 Tax=Gottfriedia acidiceleris TaxID=371036 RepID=UPI00142F4DF2|nr:MFS transporter [Gottfriedia acidiceleris]
MNRLVIIIMLLLATLINFADKTSTSVASVYIIKDFNLSYVQYGLLGSVFFWFFSVFGVIGGALSDKIGTKKLLGILLIAWSLLQFSTFFIKSFAFILIYRVLLGIFEGPFGPVAISHISKVFPEESRGTAISIGNAGGMIGAMILTPILVHVNKIYGWRISFVSLGILSLIWVLVWRFVKDNSKKTNENSEISYVKKKLKWSEFRKVLFSPTLIFTLINLFACYWLVVWVSVWLPVYLVKAIHLSETKMGFTVLTIGLINLVVSIFASIWSDKLFKKSKNLRSSRVLFSSFLQIISAGLLFTTTFVQSPGLVIGLLGVSVGLSTNILSVGPIIIMSLLPERRGLMVSIGTSFQNLAGIFGPLVCGYIIELGGNTTLKGFNYTILCTAAILFVGGTLFAIFAKPDLPFKNQTNRINYTKTKEI